MPTRRRKTTRTAKSSTSSPLAKVATGIAGFDEITGGGLPEGRPTLVCGGPGCGKTLFALEFLVHGAASNESGVFVTFEETEEDILKNVASLGYDVADLVARKRLALEYIRVERSEIEETGEYDLEGLFIRLDYALRTTRARRIVLDTIESLFAGLSNAGVLRAELRRLFAWLKERGITAVITGERGVDTLTRQGLEEYVSDCVIFLDHRVTEQISTRRLRIVKYRGSSHGTNEYPFLIDHRGIAVLPVTSLQLIHKATSDRISTGVDWLDEMFGGRGYFRASSVLLSGGAGTAKTTLAACFLDAACRRGERALYFAFEESEAETIRNMASVGIDLRQWVDADLLRFQCSRPSLLGLEAHLFAMQKFVAELDPAVVVMDPVSDFLRIGNGEDVSAMLTRQVDFLKARQVTALFTSLSSEPEAADQQLASLVDTWIFVKTLEGNGEHNRVLYVLESRGMAHSNQIREFLLTGQGIELADVYVGPEGVLTGSARQAQEAKERSDGMARLEDLEQRRVNLERRRESVEAQTAALWREFHDEAEVVEQLLSTGSTGTEDRAGQRAEQGRLRRADIDDRDAGADQVDLSEERDAEVPSR